MVAEESASPNKITTYLINFILLVLIGYFTYYFYEKHFLQGPKPPKEVELAKVNDYGAQAYIGSDLKHLVPYDVKFPIVEGVYLVEEKGGHMIFTMNSGVEVNMVDEVTIQIKKNGLDILAGEISINHPSGKLPDDFNIFSQGKLISVKNLPAIIR